MRRRKTWRFGILFILLLSSMGLHPKVTSATMRTNTAGDLAQYVNPLVGTDNGGNTFPGADVPFGMMQWSPDTTGGVPGGYAYNNPNVKGFSLTHISGAGCSIYGDVPFMPTLQPVTTSPATNQDGYTARFSHTNEQAEAGYYSVRLDSGIGVDLTATTRTGLARFTYPPTTTANLLINVGGSANGNNSAAVQVVGDDEVTGSASSGGFCGSSADYTLYFAAQFSQPFTHFGTWNGAELSRDATSSGGHSGAFLTFDTTQDPVVLARVGISFVSVQNARLNLAAESPGWDFSSVRAGAKAAWNAMLDKIEVHGGTLADTQTFYTALYHALLHPNVFSDVNGQYTGFDNVVHATQAYTQYSNFSGWDIYRSEVPLLALLAPQATSDMMQSLVTDAQQVGHLPLWALANADASIMVGNPSDPIIADAYAFGATQFDTQAAIQAMVADATRLTSDIDNYSRLGYVPQDRGSFWSATTTLEYTTADFSIAQFAQALGDIDTYATYMRRAQNWQNLYNPATGYVQQRMANGEFITQFDPTNQYGYDEGNAAQYTWMIPYNLHALFNAMGGNTQAGGRLDSFFTQLNAGPASAYAWLGNEPDLSVPWEYDFAGQPWRTQAVVRQAITDLYAPTSDGLPGNDDLGTMSAWYVWGSLGLYPEIPGVSGVVLGSPLFPQIALHLAGGDVIIAAAGASDATPYVQDLTVNNHPYTGSWLPLATLINGANLQFTMGNTPNTSRGKAAADIPPSFNTAAAPGIGFTSPNSIVAISPGQSQTFQLGVQNVTDMPLSVHWSASAPAGLTLDPASGTLSAEAVSAQSQPLQITATSDMSPGTLLIPIQLQSTGQDGGADAGSLPSMVVAVSIGAASPSTTPVAKTQTPTSIVPSSTPPATTSTPPSMTSMPTATTTRTSIALPTLVPIDTPFTYPSSPVSTSTATHAPTPTSTLPPHAAQTSTPISPTYTNAAWVLPTRAPAARSPVTRPRRVGTKHTSARARLTLRLQVVQGTVHRGQTEMILVQTQRGVVVKTRLTTVQGHAPKNIHVAIHRGQHGRLQMLVFIGVRAPLGTERLTVSARLGMQQVRASCTFRIIQSNHTTTRHRAPNAIVHIQM